MKKRSLPPFTSRQTKGEAIAAWVYLPIHVVLLPLFISFVLLRFFPDVSVPSFNFIYYAVGILYTMLFQLRFLRRDFDPLCDRFLHCFIEILSCYGLMLAWNLLMSLLFSLLPTDNPNNAAVIDMAGAEMGTVSAMAIFLAPLVEELLFRAGIFGQLRHRSRLLAYTVSILAFSLYHVWSYALLDPWELLYIVQYIPASYVLCRCYERTDTIWGPIFLHMLINGVSLSVISSLGDYLCLIL